jgi:phage baseplate assembly protein W
MAGFFDPDAPARPIRVALPIDTSPAGLRKFDKKAAFMISDILCGQIDRVKGLTLGDLVRSVLPWPLHKDLSVPDGGPCKQPGTGIPAGMICSLSLPIITICALLLLMIIVSLLDILMTDQRERVTLPEFGAGLSPFLFEPNTAATRRRIQERISTSLAQWEPRIAVESVDVDAEPDDPQAAVATVTYKLVATQTRERVSLNVRLAA